MVLFFLPSILLAGNRYEGQQQTNEKKPERCTNTIAAGLKKKNNSFILLTRYRKDGINAFFIYEQKTKKNIQQFEI
jgi:hypothetical protein